MGSDLKTKIIGRTANFIRTMKCHENKLRTTKGTCIFCGAARDELHEEECPMYKLDGVAMDVNKLFYNIKNADERQNHPDAL